MRNNNYVSRTLNARRIFWLMVFAVAGIYIISFEVYADEILDIARPDQSTITITINDAQLDELESQPNKIADILNEQSITCSRPQVRISRCAWACADESTRIRSCDTRLNRILERAFGR